MQGNVSRTVYIFSVIAILLVSLSYHLVPEAEAKDLTIETDCIDGTLILLITDKEGNPLSNVRVSTSDSLSARDSEERFYTDVDGKVSIERSSNLGFVTLSKGGYNDKALATLCESPLTETCSYKQSYMARTNTDLYIVHHWPIASGWYVPGYENINTVIVGDIVNLSDYPLTNIVISIQPSSGGIILEEPTSWYPVKKILRPGESSPFVIAPEYRGFDNYEIWVSNYQFSCIEVITPESIVDEVILDVDANGNEILTLTCTNPGKYYTQDLRIVYVGYNEANFIDLIRIGSSIGPVYIIADCLTKGSVDATPFLHYVQDTNLELFTIKGPYSLIFNLEEIKKISQTLRYDYPEGDDTIQSNIFSKYYPDSLRPKYMDLDEIRGLAEQHGSMHWTSASTLQLDYDDNSLVIDSSNYQGTIALKDERYWDAISWFDNSLELDSDNIDALYNKALALESLGLDVEANVFFDRVKKLESSPNVPEWIRNNAEWWAAGAIGDSDFTTGIQYLIKEDIIKIPETISSGDGGSQEIPAWIKNNADWWAQGLISDDDFVKGIQYLVEHGIIQV